MKLSTEPGFPLNTKSLRLNVPEIVLQCQILTDTPVLATNETSLCRQLDPLPPAHPTACYPLAAASASVQDVPKARQHPQPVPPVATRRQTSMVTQPVTATIRLPPQQQPVPRAATVPLTGQETHTVTVHRPLTVHSSARMGAMLTQTIGEIVIVIVLLLPNRQYGVLLGARVILTSMGRDIATAPPPHYHRVTLRATIRGITPTTTRAEGTATAQRPQQIHHQLVVTRLSPQLPEP